MKHPAKRIHDALLPTTQSVETNAARCGEIRDPILTRIAAKTTCQRCQHLRATRPAGGTRTYGQHHPRHATRVHTEGAGHE